MTILPYKEKKESKKQQVASMFNNISKRYDLLNHLLSAGIDKNWRKKAIKIIKEGNPKTILDIATGTGDFAIAALKADPEKVTGVDISEGMLEVGRKKIEGLGLSGKIELQKGDSEELNFPDNYFDAVIVAFGVRNFENLEKGLKEMLRVTRPGGTVLILEFSKPTNWLFKRLYYFYFKFILPTIGKMVSRDRSAYSYLPESVESFPCGAAFLDILKEAGYKSVQCIELTFGISSIYVGKKQ